MEEKINMEEKMSAETFYERLLENLENDKRVRYGTFRYVPLAMAICYPENAYPRTYVQWINLLLNACYSYSSSFHRFNLGQMAHGLLSVATALRRELDNINK